MEEINEKNLAKDIIPIIKFNGLNCNYVKTWGDML
jgi:hypothetical protein